MTTLELLNFHLVITGQNKKKEEERKGKVFLVCNTSNIIAKCESSDELEFLKRCIGL